MYCSLNCSYGGHVGATFIYTFASPSPFGNTAVISAQINGVVDPFLAIVAVYGQASSLSGTVNFQANAQVTT